MEVEIAKHQHPAATPTTELPSHSTISASTTSAFKIYSTSQSSDCQGCTKSYSYLCSPPQRYQQEAQHARPHDQPSRL